MIIANDTKQTVHYDISAPGKSDCGDLGPDDDANLASYNNISNVVLTLRIPRMGDQTQVTLTEMGL
jgi:hypothetical protein